MASRFVFKFHDLSAKSRVCFLTSNSFSLRHHSSPPPRNVSYDLIYNKHKRSYSQHMSNANETIIGANYIQNGKKSPTENTEESKLDVTTKYEDNQITKENSSEIQEYGTSVYQSTRCYELVSMKSLREKTEEENHLFNFLSAMHQTHKARILPHLQPCNAKPFNSHDNLLFPLLIKPSQYHKITYPVKSGKQSISKTEKKEIDEVQKREYSTIFKVNPGFYHSNKIAKLIPYKISDDKQNAHENETLKNKLIIYNLQFSKKNIDMITKNTVPYPSFSETIKLFKTTNSEKYSIIYSDGNMKNIDKLQRRNFCTLNGNDLSSNVIKLKLNKKTKKKLPKLIANKCPCIEESSLADMEPLERPKMSYIPMDPEKKCKDVKICDITPRADDGLVIKKKKLSKIKITDCPCIETVFLKHVPLKRLKKVVIPEPKRDISSCIIEPCPPRADKNLKIKPKKLPKLVAKYCPCVSDDPLIDIPLVRLKPVKIPDPPIICTPPQLCPARADDNLEIKPKNLPKMETSDCPCIEVEQPDLLPHLKPLKKIDIVEPPKICITPSCANNPRADDGNKIDTKRLPVIKPKECPCVPDTPLKSVPLGRPKMTYRPIDKEKICIESTCKDNPRADNGMKIKEKTLPHLVPGECPCIETEMKEDIPLIRLIPRAVIESKITKNCIEKKQCPPRSDENFEVIPKSLPILKVNNCPCIEKEELKESEPLKRLNLEFKDPDKQCSAKQICNIPRSDDNLKRKPKKLPELSVSTCPCIEDEPLKDCPPLRRLSKIKYTETKCIAPTPVCYTIPRSDKDDWTYWKLSKTKKNIKRLMNKRNYYTNSFHNRLTYSKLSNIFVSNVEMLEKITNAVAFQHNLGRSNWKLNYLNIDEDLHSLNNDISRLNSFRHMSTGKKCNPCTVRKLRQDNKTNKGEDLSFKETEKCSAKKYDKGYRRVSSCQTKKEKDKEDNFTLLQRIVNYFKARPCPSPEEFKRMRLKKEAEIAAEKAGLCVYDPKDLEKELCHMMTSENCNDKPRGPPNVSSCKIGISAQNNKCLVDKSNIDKIKFICQKQSDKKK